MVGAGVQTMRVARREPGRDVFDRNVDRKIPRRHHGVDAARLVEGHHPLGRVLGRDGGALEIFHEVGREVEAVDRLADLEVRLGIGLALLERQQPRQFLALCCDGVADPAHRPGAIPGRDLAPARLGRTRRGDGIDRRLPRAPAQQPDGAFVDRGMLRLGLALQIAAPVPADEIGFAVMRHPATCSTKVVAIDLKWFV